ncbi:MAG: hypothetical protein ABS934_06235 [Psychrobacillus sp.]
MTGRFWKQAAATVLLTSSVLSFSSVAYGDTSKVNRSFEATKAELNRSTTHYVYPALENKLVTSQSLYSSLNSAKKNYQQTRNLINSSTYSSSQKQSYLRDLDALYNEKVSKGLVPYIDAYNYATKYLDPIMKNIKSAQSRNDFAAVEKEYHKLSYQLKGRTAILYRFSGKAARDLLLEQYKKPADAKRAELMIPVTIYMETVKIKDFLNTGKLEEAQASYNEIDALLSRLPSATNNPFIAALLEEVAKVKNAIDNTTNPIQQEILNTKISTLVTTLNAAQSNIATIESTGLNALTVEVKADAKPEDIANYLGVDLFNNVVSQLGVTHVNGFTPLSPEGLAYIKAQAPEADSLDDVKGETISLPLTVNNGVPMNVDFTITFK